MMTSDRSRQARAARKKVRKSKRQRVDLHETNAITRWYKRQLSSRLRGNHNQTAKFGKGGRGGDLSLSHSGPIQLHVTSRRKRTEHFNKLGNEQLYGGTTVNREFNNGDLPLSKILLIAKIFICCQEYIEVLLGQKKKLAVLDPSPSTVLRCLHEVAGQNPPQKPRQAFVDENPHVGWTRSSRQAPPASNTLMALERVTVGKSSRNSSRLHPSAK